MPIGKNPSVLVPANHRGTFEALSKAHLLDLACSLAGRLGSSSEASMMAILRRESALVRDMRVGEFGSDLAIEDVERRAATKRIRAERRGRS